MPYTNLYSPETLTRQQVDTSTDALVLEFGSNSCGWCQGAQAHIRAAFAAHGATVRHVKVEDGRGRPLGRSFGVKLWPTLVFLQQGTEVARLVRPQHAAELTETLSRLSQATPS